ncbi:TRAP transporter large permease subunit [Nitratireductor mangrovi]|uniref:TRAP transporter large permease subunit n=1 Tax=Nitratireductor mangrovi TaxID=2599600 RepID=A0A5B8KVN5_9HYPH|nr:TRAP transporter large permease subunit [Nitratireductor mangrovi]QDY99733.1 TRAP transporter large permease subunit [Nitratireductor mangrovi]
MAQAADSGEGDRGLPAGLERFAQAIRRLIDLPARASIYVGAAALAAMMILTVSDVSLRNMFSLVVPGGMEFTGLLMIIVALTPLAAVEREGGHIRVDLLLRLVPGWLRAPTIAGGLLLTLATILITGYRIFLQARYLSDNGIVTGVTGLPEWPFVAAATLFILLFALALLGSLASALHATVQLRDSRSLAVLLAWPVAVGLILLLALFPQYAPFELPRSARGLFAISLCFILIFLGVHIAAAMAVTALVGISILVSSTASLTSLGTTTIDVVSDQTWSVVPLFTWMGLIVVASGFAEDLYRSAYRWIGHLPGGLASASTVACAGLSSIVGDTLSGVYSMGSIALPQMRKYDYDMKLATASIACAATIGVMIPPSLAFIVYGMITEVSIGKLFMAGILPGILFAFILVGLITIRAWLNPALAPRGEVSSWNERFSSSAKVWPIVVLMLLVLGGIYTGAVTPNEAGGIGVFGALVVSALTRRLTWATLWQSIERALLLSAAIIIIFMFATAFSRFIAISGLTQQLADLIIGFQLGTYQLIAAILVFYVLIGMFMNALPALVLTVPLFYPVAMSAGFDPVWFGVVVVIMVELGVVTPPIGVNVFAIAAIARDVPMYDVFRGVLPFWTAFLILIVLIVAFPQISLFLPSLM